MTGLSPAPAHGRTGSAAAKGPVRETLRESGDQSMVVRSRARTAVVQTRPRGNYL